MLLKNAAHAAFKGSIRNCTLLLCAQALLGDETIANVPVLVLGNKIDRPEAVSEGGLRGAFALDGQVTGKVVTTQQLSREVHVIDHFFSRWLSPCVISPWTGKRVAEGAERPPAGDLHVQRVEETRLRRRFPMVIAIHRLTQPNRLDPSRQGTSVNQTPSSVTENIQALCQDLQICMHTFLWSGSQWSFMLTAASVWKLTETS